MYMQMRWLFCLVAIIYTPVLLAVETELNGQRFTLADGLEIELVAGPALVERPVSADFDEAGRLYVTDSSGSNEHVDIQREKRPHRIMQLRDADGDGVFDSSTVFADQLMFPEGSLWYDGSLYVAAPPEIWKFTDVDDDGVAEQRDVWFDGKTLTHCANDLHGPYLGPDGWFYWCKGAFAEQTHERVGKSALHTKAAHIFRRHPKGGPLETVMTGGMDNPVEVVFTPGGERIFTTTFLTHPAQGKRDGLIHAVYGGVYGKEHEVLDGHPRTGDLMPPLVQMGVSASCGLARLESNGLGEGFKNNLLASSFNLHKISRHILTDQGATFATQDSDLLVSDNLDFHPTDVLEDADGSLIVVDTGGWFRLCCPTSQLEKPDVLGGIYRIKRSDAKQVSDPRGTEIDWNAQSAADLVTLLADDRFAVRKRAKQALIRLGSDAIEPLQQVRKNSNNSEHRLQSVWALTAIDNAQARAAVRQALGDDDMTVRQAALHSVSLHRDALASDQLVAMLTDGPHKTRRAAAEAIGRIGPSRSVDTLIPSAAAAHTDRFLEHSMMYAAIELNDADAIRKWLTADDVHIRRVALIALDQLEDGDHLLAADVESLLESDDDLLNDTAWWIAEHHPNWGDTVVGAFRNEIESNPQDPAIIERLTNRLKRFSRTKPVQLLMADSLSLTRSNPVLQIALIEAMSGSWQRPLPELWRKPLAEQLSGENSVVRDALNAYSRLPESSLDTNTTDQLRTITRSDSKYDDDVRLQAINLIPAGSRNLTPSDFQFVCSQLDIENDVTNRLLAVNVLKSTPLSSENLNQITLRLPQIGTMELRPLLELFAKSTDAAVGSMLVDSLLESPAATSLFPEQITAALSGFGADVTAQATPLLEQIEEENRTKVERINTVMELLPKADIRRGIRVFQSAAAACSVCHQRGYLGGDIGPDLDNIGKARGERDLLESILFPSLTFVRNYEPAAILTVNGQIYNGVIRQSSDESITLQLDAKKSIQIQKDEIEETRFSDVSIMPAGLEKQLTPQQLADLVKYLKEG